VTFPPLGSGRHRPSAGAAFCFLGVVLLCASCTPERLPAEPDPLVRFDWFEYSGSDAWFELPADADHFRNPILAGFYPDPSIVRVGDDFYLVTSSFAWYPGVPIFHSKDLVNWNQIGHVLDRPSLLPAEGIGVSRGVFAPTIRYHDGTFYMVTTMVDAGGNFYVTATDPAGPWSDPVWLSEVDGIDPSIFFDHDGRAFLLNNGPPDYEPLYDGHRAIWIQELDIASGELVGRRKVIVDGGVDLSQNPIWIEAPHLFRVDDWYYLIAAEGGTADNHSEVVFRSRDVMGPFEPGPRNPILTQRTLDPSRPFPVTTTGHADFIRTKEGDWWAVFLGCRPYEGSKFNTGRETFLHPVTWVDGWPLILDPSEPVLPASPLPDLPRGDTPSIPHNGNFTWRDEFDDLDLALVWNSLRAPPDEWIDMAAEPGVLRMTARDTHLANMGTPAFLARRQQHMNFSASVALQLPEAQGVSAGIAAFQNEKHHFFLGVRSESGEWVVFLERAAGGEPEVVARQSFDPGTSKRVLLRISAAGRPYSFDWGLGPEQWESLAKGVDGSILSTQVAGGFVGAMVGPHVRAE
jgi:xylan 1,4-beta-xylosidase